MSVSIYDDKLITPDDTMLAYDLEGTYQYLERIRNFIEQEYGSVIPEWKFYNKKSGWLLKLFNKKRNVMFVIPCNGFFRTSFIFGNKAVELVVQSKLPDSIKKELVEAKKYAEGRGISVPVRTQNDCDLILKLITIKLTKV